MRVNKIPRPLIRLAKPDIPEAVVRKISEILRSGHLVQGRHVEDFETRLKDYLGNSHAILVSSGTAALHLSLIALNIQPGDEIVVPAFTFPASANVVEVVGAKPVLIDIGLEDFCIDPSKIEAMITDKTKAIMLVHAFGQPADMEPILDIAKQYRLDLIEDAACGLGAEYKGIKIGTFGRMGCFSFHPRKAITTGEGGLVITDDAYLAEKLKALRNHGFSQKKDRTDLYYAGLNYRMTEIQAALGLFQLSGIEEGLKARVNVARRYEEGLGGADRVSTPKQLYPRQCSWQTYHVLLDGLVDRDHMISSLKAEGIETNTGAQALNCLSYYKNRYGYTENDFLNSALAYKQGLALPMGPHLGKDDIEYIVETFLRKLGP